MRASPRSASGSDVAQPYEAELKSAGLAVVAKSGIERALQHSEQTGTITIVSCCP